jgi:hypothetical protein
MKRLTIPVVTSLAFLACGSGGGAAKAAPACDGSCQDAVALLGLRDAIKLAYNLELSGQAVGAQDAGPTACPLGGTASVSGHATSNGVQGTTMVDLTYVFDQCGSSNVDTDPTHVFTITITGTVTEKGSIAVQPSTTTALVFDSASMTLSGTVYAPAIPYAAAADGGACALMLGQSGNDVSGTLCGRPAGVTL